MALVQYISVRGFWIAIDEMIVNEYFDETLTLLRNCHNVMGISEARLVRPVYIHSLLS
jgi:hypothetical protein